VRQLDDVFRNQMTGFVGGQRFNKRFVDFQNIDIQ